MAIRDQLDSLLDEAAGKQMTLREAFAFLIEREVSRKDERRIEMAFKIAHFPTSWRSRASTTVRCGRWRRRGGSCTGTPPCCWARQAWGNVSVETDLPGLARFLQDAAV